MHGNLIVAEATARELGRLNPRRSARADDPDRAEGAGTAAEGRRPLARALHPRVRRGDDRGGRDGGVVSGCSRWPGGRSGRGDAPSHGPGSD